MLLSCFSLNAMKKCPRVRIKKFKEKIKFTNSSTF